MVLLASLVFPAATLADAPDDSMKHEDSRCLCKCPDVSTVKTKSDVQLQQEDRWLNEDSRATDIEINRSIYLNASVGPNECDCAHVVLIHLNLTETQVGNLACCEFSEGFSERYHQANSIMICEVSLTYCVANFNVCYDGHATRSELLVTRGGYHD